MDVITGTETEGMCAYHGSAELKEATLAQLRAHAAADELVKGQYWAEGKGCAVGCLTHDPDGGHEHYPGAWGIPEELAYLEDRIFEGLSYEASQAWPLRFMGAIKPGADLALVWPKLAVELLVDPDYGAVRWHASGSKSAEAILAVAGLAQRTIAGEPVALDAWSLAIKDVRQEICATGYGESLGGLRVACTVAEALSDFRGETASDASTAALAELTYLGGTASVSRWVADELIALLEAAS